MRTGGQGEDWFGEAWYCPDWYPVIRSARFLSVPPWDMLPARTAAKIDRGWWLLWATISEAAEIRAENEARKEAERKARK